MSLRFWSGIHGHNGATAHVPIHVATGRDTTQNFEMNPCAADLHECSEHRGIGYCCKGRGSNGEFGPIPLPQSLLLLLAPPLLEQVQTIGLSLCRPPRLSLKLLETWKE